MRGAILGAIVMIGIAAGAEAAGTNDWSGVYGREAWYRAQNGPEQVFVGKLEAVKPPPASTLMRTSRYRLGERTLYTRGRQEPALDARVGMQVEIRGKAVDTNLEGQRLHEIWPGDVRAATATPAVQAPIHKPEPPSPHL